MKNTEAKTNKRNSSSQFNRAIAFLGIIAFSLLFNTVCAQDSAIQCNDSIYCVPSVSGLPRSKGVIFERMTTIPHDIRTRDLSGSNDVNSRIEKNRIYTMKLRGPIINKPSFKLVLGGSMTIEEFEFEENANNEALLSSLQDRPLRTVGIDLYSLKSFRSNKYLVSRLQSRLNGDYNLGESPLLDYARFSFVSALVWKLDDHRILGFGGAFSHIYGRASIVPVLIYYNSFLPKWGLEANLPANVRLRYSPNEKRFIYAGLQVRGANYRLDPTSISIPYFLEKSELDMGLTFEQEIHDWLWFGLRCGFRANLSLEVSSTNQLSLKPEGRLLETDVDNSFFYAFNLFLVVPKKWSEKK